MNPTEVLIPMTMFISAAVVIGMWITSRHRERMSAMERGMTPDMIRALFGKELRRRDKYRTLKWGMMFFFTGIGLSVVSYLDMVNERFDDGLKASAIALSIGCALLVTYFIISRQEKNLPESEQKPIDNFPTTM